MLSCFSCVQLCDPMGCSLPGSSVHEILSARILEWVAMPSPPGDIPDPGIKPMSLRSPALADRFFTTSATWEDIHTWVLANSSHALCPRLKKMFPSKEAPLLSFCFSRQPLPWAWGSHFNSTLFLSCQHLVFKSCHFHFWKSLPNCSHPPTCGLPF